jgi:Zn-dependent oligopeptidase
LQELRSFAAEQLGISTLEAWDVTYASEKLREQRYAFSEQEVKLYFPEPQVISGLFRVIQTLFGVTIRIDKADTWHPDVQFYRIEKDGQLIGQFYLDLYARQGKRRRLDGRCPWSPQNCRWHTNTGCLSGVQFHRACDGGWRAQTSLLYPR